MGISIAAKSNAIIAKKTCGKKQNENEKKRKTIFYNI